MFGAILVSSFAPNYKVLKSSGTGFNLLLAVTLMLMMFLNFLAGKNWIPTPNVQKAVSL